jgi:hypothetical protein
MFTLTILAALIVSLVVLAAIFICACLIAWLYSYSTNQAYKEAKLARTQRIGALAREEMAAQARTARRQAEDAAAFRQRYATK